MKFLHTGDLHLGKSLNDVSLLEDQRHILGKITEIALSEGVNAVLIAGDVYQRSAPQAEAMALFDSFLSGLHEAGLAVFIISGNHDSSQRISYFSSLVRSSGVHISENFSGKLQRVRMEDAHGPLYVHMLPFIKPIHARRWLPDESISTYQEAAEAVLRNSEIDTEARNILLCHQFITGSETSDSEEKSVGGLDNIDASVFDAFDYVALGHIHKPQRLMRDTLRYAGSPLKYSFSEIGHRKSVSVVEIGAKGTVDIKTVPLVPLRDMRLVNGSISEIMAMPYSEDYVWVTVNDELVPPDTRLSISTVFPNMLKFSVVNSRTSYDDDVTVRAEVENRTVDELFVDFYRSRNNDQPPSDLHMQVLLRALRELEDERHEAN